MRALPAILALALAAACTPVEKGEDVTKPASAGQAAVPAAVDREWAVFELGGAPVAGRGPTIGFGEGRIYGFGGCNRYTGPVSFSGPDGIRVGAAGMTMMACPEPQMALEQRFARALEAVARWEVADGILALKGADGAVLARARPAPPAS